MKRKYSIIPAVIIIAMSVTGCGKNNEAGGERYSDQASPIGYYSNENHNNGNATILEDNDGPLTEMMDHTAGDEERKKMQGNENLQMRNVNSNPPNPASPLADRGNSSALYDNGLSRKIEKTAERVENVRNVRAIVFGNSILIAVELNANARMEDTKKAIKNEVTGLTSGRNILITTDEESYRKAKNIAKDLRSGSYQKHTIEELHTLFQKR